MLSGCRCLVDGIMDPSLSLEPTQLEYQIHVQQLMKSIYEDIH